MENGRQPTYPVDWASWQTFFSFFLNFTIWLNENCKQIRSIHRELKSEFDLFIQFAKRLVIKFK
jgi:hypothetical protein